MRGDKKFSEIEMQIGYYQIVLQGLEKVDEIMDLVSVHEIDYEKAYHEIVRALFEIREIYL